MKTHRIIFRVPTLDGWQWHKTLDTYTYEEVFLVAANISRLGLETRIIRVQDYLTDSTTWPFDGPEENSL